MNMKKNMTKSHPKRLLGVFAHPDDESFCAGGTFARSVAHGAEVMVVSATRGEAGQIRSAGMATRQTLAWVREQELQRAFQRLGSQHARCLDYADGTLKDVDQEVLIRDVVELIRGFRPDVVITFGADGGRTGTSPPRAALPQPFSTRSMLARLGSGSFFGEEGLAYQQPRNVHVVAAEKVTCLVFSPEAPTAFLLPSARRAYPCGTHDGSHWHHGVRYAQTPRSSSDELKIVVIPREDMVRRWIIRSRTAVLFSLSVLH
jgi:hypothetical protein